MKKTLLIATLIIALAVPAAFAFKGAHKGGEKRQMPIALMAKILDMTDDQKTQFEAVMKEQQEQRNTMRDEMRQNRQQAKAEMKTKMDALDSDTLKKFKTFLNEGQIEILVEMHEQRKSNRQNRGGGKGRGEYGNGPQATAE